MFWEGLSYAYQTLDIRFEAGVQRLMPHVVGPLKAVVGRRHDYSLFKASIGFNFAAFLAGKTPKITPITMATETERTMLQIGTINVQARPAL